MFVTLSLESFRVLFFIVAFFLFFSDSEEFWGMWQPLVGSFPFMCWALWEFFRNAISHPATWKMLFKMSLLIPYAHFHSVFSPCNSFYKIWPYKLAFIFSYIIYSLFLLALIMRGLLDFMCQLITILAILFIAYCSYCTDEIPCWIYDYFRVF